jgi:hypothetical protein
MKLLKFVLPVLLVLCLLNSCKKDNQLPLSETFATQDEYPNYSKLAVGNCWIYELVNIDPYGNESTLSYLDTVVIEKDSIINGNTYYKKVGKNHSGINSLEIQWLRDSLHYIVTHTGELFFSSQDTTTILTSGVSTIDSYTVADITTKMTDMYLPISTPSGSFNACNAKRIYQGQPGYLYGADFTRYAHRYHAENIGIVRETVQVWASAPIYLERRLLSYSVQ